VAYEDRIHPEVNKFDHQVLHPRLELKAYVQQTLQIFFTIFLSLQHKYKKITLKVVIACTTKASVIICLAMMTICTLTIIFLIHLHFGSGSYTCTPKMAE
jgi:phosphatidylglycerophosphatase A